MFYCEKCRVKRGWPESFRGSYGPCECCKVVGNCHDVPSKHLPANNEKE